MVGRRTCKSVSRIFSLKFVKGNLRQAATPNAVSIWVAALIIAGGPHRKYSMLLRIGMRIEVFTFQDFMDKAGVRRPVIFGQRF